MATPWSALVGPAIGAGFGIADLIKGPSAAQKATQTGLTNNINSSADAAKTFTGAGEGATGTAQNYFTSLLGNRSQALDAASPEVSTVMDQFDSAHKAAAEFNPRGGGRATLNAQKPYQMAGVVGKLLSASRNNAASTLGNLGINEEGLGVSATNAGTTAASDLGKNELDYQKQKASEYGSIGSGIGGILGKLIANKGGGGSGAVDGGD